MILKKLFLTMDGIGSDDFENEKPNIAKKIKEFNLGRIITLNNDKIDCQELSKDHVHRNLRLHIKMEGTTLFIEIKKQNPPILKSGTVKEGLKAERYYSDGDIREVVYIRKERTVDDKEVDSYFPMDGWKTLKKYVRNDKDTYKT